MLFYAMWIPALLVTIGVYSIWDLSWWWLVPVLLGGYVLCTAIYVLYVWILCMTVDMDREYDDIPPFYRREMLVLIDWLLAFCGVDWTVTGKEKLPEGEFLLVSNHRSGFDPLVTMAAMKDRPFAFISKPENIYKIFVGRTAYRCGFLPIDRDNARNALKTINTAAARMKNHLCSYGIYPEGTRTKTGDLQEFRNGAFKAAQKANVPIVVAAIEGTEHVFHGHFPLRRTKAQLSILGVLEADTVKHSRTHEISAMVREAILKKIGH